jgi:hypothetical protein
MRKAVIAARDMALGMGHVQRVGPELQYDVSKPLGSRDACVVKSMSALLWIETPS